MGPMPAPIAVLSEVESLPSERTMGIRLMGMSGTTMGRTSESSGRSNVIGSPSTWTSKLTSVFGMWTLTVAPPDSPSTLRCKFTGIGVAALPTPCTVKDCTVRPVMAPVMGMLRIPPPPMVSGICGMVMV